MQKTREKHRPEYYSIGKKILNYLGLFCSLLETEGIKAIMQEMIAMKDGQWRANREITYFSKENRTNEIGKKKSKI